MTQTRFGPLRKTHKTSLALLAEANEADLAMARAIEARKKELEGRLAAVRARIARRTSSTLQGLVEDMGQDVPKGVELDVAIEGEHTYLVVKGEGKAEPKAS